MSIVQLFKAYSLKKNYTYIYSMVRAYLKKFKKYVGKMFKNKCFTLDKY